MCARCATDAASPSVVISNLSMAFDALMNIGFTFVYQEISLPVFLGMEGVESRSPGPGRSPSVRRARTSSRRARTAESLPMTRTTTSDASERPSTCADQVTTLKAPKTSPSCPTLEGKTTLESNLPRRRRVAGLYWRLLLMAHIKIGRAHV